MDSHPPVARRSRFSTDPAYHVDLLQMLATVVIGSRDQDAAHKHEGRSFGIELVEELPRVFSGDAEAYAFIYAYGESRGLREDFAWNPLYGRSDLAPLIFAEGKQREGQPFHVRFAFRRAGTKLTTRKSLFYAHLESPRSLYHAIRLPIWRITEFQTFVATMIADPGRRQRYVNFLASRLGLGESALVQGGLFGTITLWNYDLPASDPSRLMTPTHAAWYWKARTVAEQALSGARPRRPAKIDAWDIDAHAFLNAVPGIRVRDRNGRLPGVVQIPSELVDESDLISVLLRRGSRRISDVATQTGDLLLDRYYQTALPSPLLQKPLPLYGPSRPSAGSAQQYLCARERRIPVCSARNLDELRTAIRAVQPEQSNGLLLYRGQRRHYQLERPEPERRILYGAHDVDEISFLTSASREDSFSYDAFHGRFQLYLQGLLYENVPGQAFGKAVTDEKRRLIRPFEDDWIESTYRKWRTWYGESIWDLIVMGLAQHYGIPTHGLDLTDSLEIALWFALNRSFLHERQGVTRCWYRRIDSWVSSDCPVLYVVEVQRQLKHHLESAIRDLPLPHPLRVERQSAYLHYGGWALQANICAEDVRLAVFLDPGFEAPDLPSTRHLFPGPTEDPFYRRMLAARSAAFGNEVFGRIVEYEDPDDGALYEAVMMERFDEARTLLRGGAGVHHSDSRADTNRGLTALHWAAFYGEIDLIRRLLERGANIEESDANGRRPLVCAAMRGRSEAVRYLLSKGARLTAMEYDGWLTIPPTRRPPEVVEVLREYAIQLNYDPGITAERGGLDEIPAFADYQNVIAGAQHQELFFLFSSVLCVYPLEFPLDLREAFGTSTHKANDTVIALGVPTAITEVFRRACDHLSSGGAFRVTGGLSDPGAEEDRIVRDVNQAMGKVRQALDRTHMIRYTAGLCTVSAAIHARLLLSSPNVQNAITGGEALSRQLCAERLVNTGKVFESFIREAFGLEGGFPGALAPSYLECPVSISKLVLDNPTVPTTVVHEVLRAAKALFRFYGYKPLFPQLFDLLEATVKLR